MKNVAKDIEKQGNELTISQDSLCTEQKTQFVIKIQNSAKTICSNGFGISLPICILFLVYSYKVVIRNKEHWDIIKRISNDFIIDLILILYTYDITRGVALIENSSVKGVFVIKTVITAILLLLCCVFRKIYEENYNSEEGNTLCAILAVVVNIILFFVYLFVMFNVFNF